MKNSNDKINNNDTKNNFNLIDHSLDNSLFKENKIEKSYISNFIDPFLESIDDPNLPFEKRWQLTSELDQINHKFGVYKEFLSKWKKLIKKAKPNKRFSVLEVGSGSGGLSLEIQKWCFKKGYIVDIHLYDSQLDILEKSSSRLSNGVQIHLATNSHLNIFKDQEFDFVISLNVIHHIQPISAAVDGISEMFRIARFGILSMDLMNTPIAIPVAHIYQKIFGISKELGEDGIKSIKRSHSFIQLRKEISDLPSLTNFDYQMKKFILAPYWTLFGVRLTNNC